MFINANNVFRTRRVFVAAVLSLSVLVPGSFRAATAQPPAAPPPATAPATETPKARRAARANPLNEALKGLELTADQKSKIKEIRAQSRKDMDTISDRRSPEGQAKLRELNAKIAADVKASLPADVQTKFQAAYDAAEAKNAEQTRTQGVTAGLADFKSPLAALGLTPEQQSKIDPIAKESYEKIVATRQDQTLKGKQRTEKIGTVVTEMKAKVRPLLTATQQTQFDTLDLTPKAAQGRRRRGAQGRPAGGTTAPVTPVAP